MLEKFQELSKETKIVLLALIFVGFFGFIILLSSLFNNSGEELESLETTPSQTEESTTPVPPMPEPDNEPSEPATFDPNAPENYPEDAFPEDLLDYETEVDENHYQTAFTFLMKMCNKQEGVSDESLIRSAMLEEKHLTTVEQYENLMFGELYSSVECSVFDDSTIEMGEGFQRTEINLFVDLRSELPTLDRFSTVTYVVDTVEEEDGYHVVDAKLANPEFYR